MTPPGAQAGLLPAVLLAACLFSPVAVGLSIADGHGSEGRVRMEPDGDSDDGSMGPYEGGPLDGEPDAHVYDFEKNTLEFSRVGYDNFPSNGRVALVLRGASFRNFEHKDSWCLPNDVKAKQMQREATSALVENVIVPLEQAGNKVDVILTDRRCNLTRSELLPLIGEQRVKVFEQVHGGNQNLNIMFALNLLANHSGGLDEVANKYRHVFLMRHDTHFTKPMNDWPEADFSKVLFPYKCPGWAGGVGVHDLFFLVPAVYFRRWYKTIDLKQCFEKADGHLCLRAMVWHAGEDSVDVAVRYDGTNPEKVFWYTYGKVRPTC